MVPDATSGLPETCASDGYKGASAEAVATHERKLATFQVPTQERVLMRIYAAEVSKKRSERTMALSFVYYSVLV